MQKLKPHKGCSCIHCRRGKTKAFTKAIERRFRRKSKQKLYTKIEEFENEPNPTGYSD